MIAISVPDVMLPRDSGGYRWVVAIAAFFTQFIICGITYSIGVFHIVFSKIFNEDHFNTSWIGSILLYSTALTSKRILNFFKFELSQWAFSKDTVSKIQWFIQCDKNFQNAWMCMQNLQGLWNMFKHWVKRFYNPCTYNAIYHKIFSAKIIINAIENFWGFCQKKIIKLIKTCHSLYFDDFLNVFVWHYRCGDAIFHGSVWMPMERDPRRAGLGSRTVHGNGGHWDVPGVSYFWGAYR